MANITSTLVADSTPTIIAAEALQYLRANTVLARLVNRNYENEVAEYGNVVKIPYGGTMSVNDKAADTVITLQAPDDAVYTLTLTKHKEVSFILEDIAKAFARPDWFSVYAAAAMSVLEAVEAVLRERLSAIACDDPTRLDEWLHDRPDARLAVALPGTADFGQISAFTAAGGSLAEKVRCDDPVFRAVLNDWLGSVRMAETLAEALVQRKDLPDNASIVTRGGDLLTRSSLTFFAPDQGEHGLLERQREIEGLAEGIAMADDKVADLREQLAIFDEHLADKQEAIGETRQYVTDRQQRVHVVQMDVLKLSQAIERYREQKARVSEQLAELKEEEESEREREMAADERIEEIRDGLSRIRVLVAGAQTGSTSASAPCSPSANVMPISTGPCAKPFSLNLPRNSNKTIASSLVNSIFTFS